MMSGRQAVKQLCESCGKSYVDLPLHRKGKKHQRRLTQRPMDFATVEAVKCPTR